MSFDQQSLTLLKTESVRHFSLTRLILQCFCNTLSIPPYVHSKHKQQVQVLTCLRIVKCYLCKRQNEELFLTVISVRKYSSYG